ncbi:zinc finger, C2H2 type [Trichuris suis]|nr:zinc finger, C2H2 type [Trichuris suis]
MLKTSPYEALGPNSCVSISPSAVFDLVFMVLYGSQAIPVQLKILLDRLLSVVDANTRLSLLDSFGWSVDDYARGYILQDRLGHKLLFWNMCSRYEEQVILPQFLRFAETKPLVMKMMGIGQSACLSSPFGASTDVHCVQQDLNSLTNSTLTDGMKSRISNIPSGDREGEDGNLLPSFDSSEAILHASEQAQYHVNIGGFSEQDLVDIVGRTCSKLIKSQNGTIGNEQDALTSLNLQNPVGAADLASSKWKSPAEAPGAVVGAGTEFIGSNASRSYRSNHATEQDMTANKRWIMHTVVEALFRSSLMLFIRRFHPWNLSSLGTNPLTGKKRVQCRVCLKTFCDKGALKIHISAVHLREMHKCTIEGCNMMFSSRRSRNRHSANPNPKLHSTVLRRNSGPLPGCRVISPPCAVDNFQPFVEQCSTSPKAQTPSYDDISSPVKSGGNAVDVRTSSSPLERCSSRKRKSDHPTKLEVTTADAPKKHQLDELCRQSAADKASVEEAKIEVNDTSSGCYDSASSLSSACSSVDNGTTTSQQLSFGSAEASCPKKAYRSDDMLNGDSHKDDSPSNLLALRIRELCNLRQCYGLSASQFADAIQSVNDAVEKTVEEAMRDSTTQSSIIITRCKTAGGGTIEIPINEKNPRQCSACGKMFQNHFSVKTHYQNVHLKVMHGCTVRGCTAAFPSKRSRDRHSANQNLHRRLLNGGNDLTEQEIIGGAKEPFPFGGLVNNCTPSSSPFLAADLINSSALAVASAAFYGALRNPVISEESLLPPTLSMPVVSPYLAGQLAAAAAGFPQDEEGSLNACADS